jgi:biotin transport system substrate-specific component
MFLKILINIIVNTKKITIRELCRAGVFTAIIAVCAQISIPMPYGVPMTLQTFAVPLAGIVLGPKTGTLSVLAYISLGLIGVPVFANFTGGVGVIFGPTGGFILSFPVMAVTAGAAGGKNNGFWLICGLFFGTAINYLCGMLFFAFITTCDIQTAFIACVLPFVPTAVIKIIMAAVTGRIIKKTLN